MNNFLTSAALLLTAAVLSANVSAQFPPPGSQPSPEQMEQMKAMQEQAMNMMKPVIEEVFDDSDADENGTLDKDELLDFSVGMTKAQAKIMAESGMQVPQPSDAELSQLKEEMKQGLDEGFKRADTDESGGVTKEEILKAMFGDAYSGEEEGEEPEGSSDDDNANGSDDSKESATEEP